MVLLAAGIVTGIARGDEPDGAAVYRQKCARCHGTAGEGGKEYPQPLVGNRSLPQLAKYIAKYMPDDAPGTCKGPDAEKVAAYIFDAFYSPAAQARTKAPHAAFARLTVAQYRYAVADLVGGTPTAKDSQSAKTEQGLRGEYYTGAGKRKRSLAFARVDPVVHFDFGPGSPDFNQLKTPEFAATWQGSVIALETGRYEFIVRTEHATQLWVNDLKKPLIDKMVKSGTDTEFRGSIFLLAGRAYPLKLEFSRGTVGVRKDPKDKLRQEKTTISLEWKPPHRAAEVISERNLTPAGAAPSFAPAVKMPPDDRSAGYERGSAISKEWVEATSDGAIESAAYVAVHLADLSGVRGDVPDRKAKLQAYCLRFAERAFRRPLTPDEKNLYVDRQFVAAKDPDQAVTRVVLLVLQSPRFLYREPALARGNAFHVAARIAFSLADTLPDRALLDAAAAGKLATRSDVLREAERLLTDRRTRTKLGGFFLQWLKVDQVADLPKDPKQFPGFDASTVSDQRTSLELFVDDVMWSQGSDYRQLLLSNDLYLNGRLAKWYGGDLAADAGFRKVACKPGERAGVLTHPYLMAAFSYTATSSPIHRGVFLARNLLGVPLRPPADAFTPLPPELHPNLNTRERITLQTSPKNCQSCHGIINPLGFTLENFDAIGRFRDKEKDKPIDVTGHFVTRSGEPVRFNDVHDLARFVAGSEEAQEAFVARLFHHTVRQPILAYGPDKLGELRRFFAENHFDMRRLLVEIVAQAALPERAKGAAQASN
jgi:mono/diheme cytochrome c family protein